MERARCATEPLKLLLKRSQLLFNGFNSVRSVVCVLSEKRFLASLPNDLVITLPYYADSYGVAVVPLTSDFGTFEHVCDAFYRRITFLPSAVSVKAVGHLERAVRHICSVDNLCYGVDI